MDIVSYVNNAARNGYGVWIGVDDSQALVENPSAWQAHTALVAQGQALDPAPTLVYVKFGGDWGGLWGTPENWSALHQAHSEIVPYLYCVPQHASAYTGLVGTLLGAGFPFVVLDVEFEWQHQQDALRNMLATINTEQNPIALCGLAWFGGFGGYEGYAQVVNDNPSMLYMPMAYFSELTRVENLPLPPMPPDAEKPTTALEYTRAWLDALFPNRPMSVIIDSASLRDSDAETFWSDSVAPSIWYSGTLDPKTWHGLSHVAPPDVQVAYAQSDIDAANTNIGQSFVWLDDLRGRVSGQESIALIDAVIEALHTARHLLRGE